MKPKPAESRHWFQTSTVLRSRQLRWVLGGLGVLLVGATVGWAANEVFSPPTDAFDSTSYSLAEVISGEVGSSISLNVVAEWTPSHAGTNLATGTVTKISIQPGDEVTQGTILYSVNLRPVSIAQGETPAFRPLARGTTGEDVGQLQGMLAALGYYSGPVDGKFLGSTQVAVRAWQKGLGLAVDGVVQPGDIIFVSSLPARVMLDPEVIERGAVLGGGEKALDQLGSAPTLSMSVTDAQVLLMPIGTRVEVSGPSGEEWEGYVGAQTADESQGIILILEGKEDAALCDDECSSIGVIGQTYLTSRVITAEVVSGLVVPTAAVVTGANGILLVIDDKGKAREVTVLGSAKGQSVIEGVAVGTLVRVPDAGQN